MQVEELMRRNIEALKVRPEFHNRLIPADDKQVRLTQEWILEHEEAILSDLRALRKSADETLRSAPGIQEELAAWKREYPIGLCKPIRDAMWEGIKKEMMRGEGEGFNMLAGFLEAGGIMQCFWGIDKGIYFENAIQLGDAVLDVANDTVNPNKEPVILYPTQALSTIKRIETFSEFAKTSEIYWHHDAYPNIYLPHLAPVFPVIAIATVRKDAEVFSGRLMLQTGVADLHLKNLVTERSGYACGLAYDFLFGSEYAEKRLPPNVLQSLIENTGLQRRGPAYTVAIEPSAARDVFAALQITDGRISPAQQRAVGHMRDAGLALEGVILGRVRMAP